MARERRVPEGFDDFSDTDALLDLPRIASLTLSPDGSRLVAEIQQPDEHGSRYVGALWELDPEGGDPARRLTFSAKGEQAPRFAPDGSVLFGSARPDPEDDTVTGRQLWRLPVHGEARTVADAPGGLTLQGIADDGLLLAMTSVLTAPTGSAAEPEAGSLAQDADRRRQRKESGSTGILHTGMPIRYWDHEIGDTAGRLVAVHPDGELTDLTPDADPLALLNASAALARHGGFAITQWTERGRRGTDRTSLALLRLRRTRTGLTARRTWLLRGSADREYGAPVLSPAADRLACLRRTAITRHDTSYARLEIHPLQPDGRLAGEPLAVDVGDLTVSELRWSADGRTLWVAGDLHSRGAVLAVDATTGRSRTIADDAVYSSLAPSPDGRWVYALRSAIDSPARPVRLPARRRGPARELPAPGTIGALPGRLEWVSTQVTHPEGGTVTVGGWLCTPRVASAASPAPLQVWVHGGPHGSYNAWSWRWCPWVAVARGYAVLLPDPAMSTGYGDAGLNRGWPRRADVVWREVEALTDQVLTRSTLDHTRTALLGASFGGFMTNWIAGHTTRFDAIVTHAGLWALDQQHATTDAAAGKHAAHGRLEEDPQHYALLSPHQRIAAIRTPMLVTHGVRDYRVPVSEALRLWWDLVSHWDGPPETMPHRLLQFTDENHWILKPSNAKLWVRTVLDFCDTHVLGRRT